MMSLQLAIILAKFLYINKQIHPNIPEVKS
jgi:hypothetical protein